MSDNLEKQHLSDMIFASLQDSPQQRRSEDRLRRAVEAAETLLREGGPESCSIPEVAKLSGVPRAAIYRYFPDRAALLSAMAAAKMDLLGAAVTGMIAATPDPRPAKLVSAAVAATVRFYNGDPVAAVLLFGGPFGAADRTSHHLKSQLLVDALKARLPDDVTEETLALGLEIVFACLRYGYFRDGHVAPAIEVEARRAALTFLKLDETG